MANKSFNSGSLTSYTVGNWVYLYTFTTTESTNAIILSLIMRNNTPSETVSPAITMSAKIVDSDDNDVCIIVNDEILSLNDEYKIDRSKQFFVLKTGWSIKVKFDKPNMITYYSVLENIQ